MLRTKLLNTTCGLLLVMGAGSAQANSNVPATAASFSIPAQNLSAALAVFGQQANVSILFDPILVDGKHSRSVSGVQSADQALAQMLQGTSLTFKRAASGAFVVTKLAARATPVAARWGTKPVVTAAISAPVAIPADVPSNAGLEEIVVTAEKKSESLQRTPISIVALGGADLENLRVSDVTDLGNSVPNVQQQAHPSSGSSPLISIRGIGAMDNQVTQDPSVGIYVDGVYVARNQGMGTQIADLERVEVLRGPQGTLYGRNATGGAINFITRQPRMGAGCHPWLGQS